MSEDFYFECIEWLKPLGYQVHSHNADKTSATFLKFGSENSPAIVCNIEGGYKSCEVVDRSNLMLFITLTSGKLQFKHPDILQYVMFIKHYTTVCKANSPFKYFDQL